MTITEIAEELDLPEQFVVYIYKTATVSFNIHTIRLDKGISLDDLIKGSGVEARRVRNWDEIGRIISNYISDHDIDFDQAFVELVRRGEKVTQLIFGWPSNP